MREVLGESVGYHCYLSSTVALLVLSRCVMNSYDVRGGAGEETVRVVRGGERGGVKCDGNVKLLLLLLLFFPSHLCFLCLIRVLMRRKEREGRRKQKNKRERINFHLADEKRLLNEI